MTHSNLEILTLSFDGYKDVWPLHYESILEYWPDCPYRLNLLTNHLDYEDSRIHSLKVGDDKDWSSSLIKALQSIQSDYILFFYDDFIFKEKFDTTVIQKWIDLAIQNDYNYLRLRPRPVPDQLIDPSYGALSSDAKYRVSLCCAIMKKQTLLSLLKKGESPWEFELYGTYRSRQLKDFYATSHHVITYYNAIEKRQWNKTVKHILEAKNVDISIRGIYKDRKQPLIKRVRGFIFNKILPKRIQNFILGSTSKTTS